MRTHFIIEANILFCTSEEMLFRGIVLPVGFLSLACREKGLGHSVARRSGRSGRGLLYSIFFEQICQCFRYVLFPTVTVEGQVLRLPTLLKCSLKSSSDQVCTYVLGYSPTDDFARVQIQDDAKIDSVTFDFEACNIVDSYCFSFLLFN